MSSACIRGGKTEQLFCWWLKYIYSGVIICNYHSIMNNNAWLWLQGVPKKVTLYRSWRGRSHDTPNEIVFMFSLCPCSWIIEFYGKRSYFEFQKQSSSTCGSSVVLKHSNNNIKIISIVSGLLDILYRSFSTSRHRVEIAYDTFRYGWSGSWF